MVSVKVSDTHLTQCTTKSISLVVWVTYTVIHQHSQSKVASISVMCSLPKQMVKISWLSSLLSAMVMSTFVDLSNHPTLVSCLKHLMGRVMHSFGWMQKRTDLFKTVKCKELGQQKSQPNIQIWINFQLHRGKPMTMQLLFHFLSQSAHAQLRQQQSTI